MNKYNILVLDREADTAKIIKKALGEEHNIIVCEEVEQARQKTKDKKIQLAVAEQEINGMSGLDFLKELTQSNSEVIKIVLASYANADVLLDIINNNKVHKYLLKPLDEKEVADIVKEELKKYSVIKKREELIESIKERYSKTVMMLANSLEARDSYVQGHSERVAYACTRIAHKMKLPQKDIDLLYTACLLHDIGKIGVPEKIFRKTEKLNDEDLMYIKAHTDVGVRLLSEVPGLEEIIPIVKHHHERIDGKGYPDELKGEEIPFLARLMSVVDTFDAITSDRPYRKGRSFTQAIEILEEVKGSQIDEEITNVFITMLKEKDINSLWELE